MIGLQLSKLINFLLQARSRRVFLALDGVVMFTQCGELFLMLGLRGSDLLLRGVEFLLRLPDNVFFFVNKHRALLGELLLVIGLKRRELLFRRVHILLRFEDSVIFLTRERVAMLRGGVELFLLIRNLLPERFNFLPRVGDRAF